MIRLCIFLVVATFQVAAADFPAKPVRLIVPFPPGGPLDIVGRLVARKLQEQWGQSVVVDNRAGASGAIGTDQLAKSAPDGHTIAVNSTPIVATPHLQKLPYDTLRDIAGVSQIAEIEYVLVATPKSGVTAFGELLAAAKKQPGTLNYASAGNGSGQHLYMELTKGATGLNLNHVPYRGAAGKLRALLVTGTRPIEALPGVPPFESALPGVGITAWHGIFAPASTPKPILEQLGADIGRAVLSPEVSARLRELGFQPTGFPYPRFNETVARDFERWGKVIRDNNIRAD
jgi:tripartite-type tricarboxylate transporter receptor subunit TctC